MARRPSLESRALRRSFRIVSATAPRKQVGESWIVDRAKLLRGDAAWRDVTSNGQPLAELRAFELADETPHVTLERNTKTFRYMLARDYRRQAADARAMARRIKGSWAGLVDVLVNGGAELPTSLRSVARSEGHTEVIRELVGRARWYEGRAGAQLPRFDTVRSCGTRALRVSCRVCATSLCEPIPCACCVVRVCDDCADARAARKQIGIAQARASAILNGYDAGLFYKKRRGGAFSEKMVTLTVPHFTRADADAFSVAHATKKKPQSEVVADCTRGLGDAGLRFWDNDVNARIAALRLAWPKFMRRVRAWLRAVDPAGARAFRYYRLFEWTLGHDGKGHPHYHAYFFSPWLDVTLCRRWWADALESVGVPLPMSCKACPPRVECTCPEGVECTCATCTYASDGRHVVIDVKRLAGFNYNALRELVKSGDRKAIETKLGVLRAPGLDGIEYAMAWTQSDAFAELPPESRAATAEVERDLYIANEGRRLAQGSMGFSLAMRRPSCACCGQSLFSASVAYGFEACDEARAPVDRVLFHWEERGPPNDRHGPS